MGFELINVGVYGLKNKEKLKGIETGDSREYEAKGFNFHVFDNDENLQANLFDHRPQVILTFGEFKTFHNILNSSIELRKRWLHFEKEEEIAPAAIANHIMATFLANATSKRYPDEPLVSVFTPTYKTGDKIRRPFTSLLSQTYKNWEWVIYDDSPDDNKTFNEMVELAKKDSRISVFKAHSPCGIIGEVKRRACMLAKGEILVELDHDDELTDRGLEWIVDAFRKFPDAGFAYTDCAEVFDDGRNAMYKDGWAFGYGSYRQENYKGKLYAVTNFPSVNAKTIRHIVAAPNHIRAWKKDAYIQIGGHGSDIHVADDYELCVRTFLKTRMIHVKKLGYIQYYNVNEGSGNTQKIRNKEIQRLVKYFRSRYDNEIHKRLEELKVDDFVWTPNGLNWDIVPEKAPIANYEYI